eukprot:CAMPEP_0170230374 /NCGR_PEP_ID=MMETSP0116_2-20130129/14919_1 /TAXON_ID=400756 /ORGANISM="Durinskia baltica, Strain CSIRO CS-38" /LENGTH=180 /DNA_ID=CAMNT_0010481141 /DNA_START=745 /DNA_END=1286 /DNA_ORIENTATION=+
MSGSEPPSRCPTHTSPPPPASLSSASRRAFSSGAWPRNRASGTCATSARRIGSRGQAARTHGAAELRGGSSMRASAPQPAAGHLAALPMATLARQHRWRQTSQQKCAPQEKAAELLTPLAWQMLQAGGALAKLGARSSSSPAAKYRSARGIGACACGSTPLRAAVGRCLHSTWQPPCGVE